MPNNTNERYRYATVALIWLGALLLGAMLVATDSVKGESIGALMGGALFLSAAMATGVMFQWGQTASAAEAAHDSKAKNDAHGLGPMALLTDEDLEELRADIKASMRRRLLQDADGELNSIDALLADQDQRQRRQGAS